MSIDRAVFTDYLCCISSLIRRLDHRILAQRDTSHLKFVLITELFKNLQAPFLKAPTVTRVIEITAQLVHHTLHEDGFLGIFDMLSEISTLCCLLYARKESPHVFVAAATLGRVEDLQELEAILQVMPFRVEWVFAALEHLQQSLPDERRESSEDGGRWDSSTTFAVRSLLQFLILSDAGNFPNQPSEDAMNMIVSALLVPLPADISFAAFLVLCKTRTGSLSSITRQKSSVWKHLGRVALAYPRGASRYITLGAHLANITEWKPFMQSELCTWINVLTAVSRWQWGKNTEGAGTETYLTQFVSVVRSIWVLDFPSDHERLLDSTNTSWIFAIAALSKAWQSFDFSLEDFFPLTRCTVSQCSP
ncbi:hypothetical protein B0H16DRAFT_594959 [Mycena metata]|uniref:Uncharacterized protein n=1 Tax=Mycena metata TaxID=1033252 RepID=A0AAD7JAB2_9AGAR|nr:hypothetical protein B0H16DRAFT_594959 [Mycena metata]